MNSTWIGRDCKFVWRRASNTGSMQFGSETFGANSGAPDPAIDYLVRIEKADGTRLRQEYVKDIAYTYTFEKNFEDTGGAPLRSFTIKVYARNIYALSAVPAQLAVTNPPPPVPTAISATSGAGSITIACALPTDTDVAGLVIYRSSASGFTPGPANLVYQGPNSSVVFDGLAPNNTYYFRVAAFDTFGTDTLNLSSEISAATVAQLSAISQDLGDITAGSIRGVNVNASSHTTKGSYLSSVLAGGETTVNVRHTDDFAASGAGVIIDTTNDRNSFTYTGKTSGTLTGCSGVLAHNNGATILPLVKGMVIDAPTNEMRFYGDRGDGTIEELAAIGIADGGASDFAVLRIGTSALARIAALFSGNYAAALFHVRNSGAGVTIYAEGLGGGAGIQAQSVSGIGGIFFGNTTKGNLSLPDVGSSFPTSKAADQIANKGTRLYQADGSHWYPLTMPYFESSEQTITASSTITVSHGLTDGAGNNRAPSFVYCLMRIKTADLGWAVGDEILVGMSGNTSQVEGLAVYGNATSVGIRINASAFYLTRRDGSSPDPTGITPANSKLVFRAW